MTVTVLFTSVFMFLSAVSIKKMIPIYFFSGQRMTSGCRGEREGTMSQFISNWVFISNGFYDSW